MSKFSCGLQCVARERMSHEHIFANKVFFKPCQKFPFKLHGTYMHLSYLYTRIYNIHTMLSPKSSNTSCVYASVKY